MNRRDFTLLLADQILYTAKLLQPLGMAIQIDWVKRSTYDQLQLFNAKRSKCDGTKLISAHQKTMAADLLVIGPNKKGTLMSLDPRKECPDIWLMVRQHWHVLGGEEMLSWDPCHFEVK